MLPGAELKAEAAAVRQDGAGTERETKEECRGGQGSAVEKSTRFQGPFCL